MDTATRRKRLTFRSAHRGSKETDLILGPYAQKHLPHMSEAELDQFEGFLEESDTDIWDWVSGKSSPGGGRYGELLDSLRKIYTLTD